MRQYRIFGYVAGEIWMPCEICWKPFDTGWFLWVMLAVKAVFFAIVAFILQAL